MRLISTRFLFLGLAMLLAACANNAPPAEHFAAPSFADKPGFALDIARVEIVSKYVSNSNAPHIELDIPLSPENALKAWARDRLLPRGKQGVLRMTINDAHVTQTPLTKEEGAKALFTNQQAFKIDVAVDITLQMLDERQFVTAEVTGQAQRSTTLPEDIKLNQRDRIIHDLVIETVKAMDDQTDPQIRNVFQKFMVM